MISLEKAIKNAEELDSENKILKGKISELNSDRKLATKDIKALKKEVKHIEHDSRKKC